ncbi:MAG: biopolymer transporter ExbD [Sedimentisphaerales bacterium]|nr:biopolymer transporter ExbD [Sedimentisphaerales bacterium]
MKKISAIKKSPRSIQFNLTAMIDVVFILITFFMLICRSIGQENYKLSVPDECSTAQVVDQSEQGGLTVSVFPRVPKVPVPATAAQGLGHGQAGIAQAVYAVRSRTFDPQSVDYIGNRQLLLAEMTSEIKQAVQQKGESVVHLRVDKNLSYAEVQPILQALALAKVKTVHLAAYRVDQPDEVAAQRPTD